MKQLSNIFEFAPSYKKTDWDDLDAMMSDIIQFLNQHHKETISNNDYGGINSDVEPRIGFISDLNGKEWSIKLTDLRNSKSSLRNLFKTREGRTKILEILNRK